MKDQYKQAVVNFSKLRRLKISSKNKKASSSNLITLLVFLIICSYTNAQDPQFTQFFANPLYLNPAFTGTTECPRIAMNYRNEWPSLSGTFVTHTASFDNYYEEIKGGIGLLILSDRAGGGTLNTINGSLLYSHYLEINRKFSVRVGFQVGYIQKKVDWDKLTFGDMIDPRYGFIYETAETNVRDTRDNLDIGVGALGFSKNLFGGFSVHHLTQPKEGFIKDDQAHLPMKLTAHMGAMIPLKEYGSDFVISPNVIYQIQQDFKQVNLGFYIKKKIIYGGLWYRQAEKNADSFSALFGFQMGVVRIGYSYDITLSKLNNASGGSNELSMVINFNCRSGKSKVRPIKCASWGSTFLSFY